jgi:hypothetical protein
MPKFKPSKMLVMTALGVAVFFGLAKKSISTEVDIKGVYFNEGMPTQNSDLSVSLVAYDVSAKILKNDLEAINAFDRRHFIKIIGRTDDRECKENECKDMSLRRAQMIYQWMISNGASRSRFLPAEGHGSDDPVDNNDLARGRARNRSVELLVVTPKS